MFPGTRQELLGIREAIWRAWFANDTVQLAEFLDPRLLSIPPTGSQWHGLQDVLRESGEFAAAGGRLVRIEFPKTQVESFGSIAVLHSTFRFEIERDGARAALAGRLTEVFELRDDRWICTSRHIDNES
jgi:ketosteroid isomerase-like protein